MVPEIWSMTDKTFCHIRHFLHFYPCNNPKNQNFEKIKNKKQPGDIIILHKCTKNHDHVLYCSWDMAHNGHNCYFSFWAFFCPFTPLTTQKIKILKNEKTPGDIIILHMCSKSYDQMMYSSWDMVHDRQTHRRKMWYIEVGVPLKN